MSWGGIEEENRLARFVPEDEDVEDEDVAVRHTLLLVILGDDPKATLLALSSIIKTSKRVVPCKS